jgi:uncharacterized protein (UPF0332 family)
MGTLNKLVWEIFIEESMGEEKAQEYVERILEFSEDMSYITYRNVLEEIHNGRHPLDTDFEDVIPKELKQ